MAGRRPLPDIMSEALGRLEPVGRESQAPKLLALAPEAQAQGPLAQRLRSMRFSGMAQALEEHGSDPAWRQADFNHRLDILLTAEQRLRERKRFKARMKKAAPRQQASLAEVTLRPEQGLGRELWLRLSSGDWLSEGRNLVLTGPTGCGKTFLACALVREVCLLGGQALYRPLPALLSQLAACKGGKSHPKLFKQLISCDFLALDDWGLTPLSVEQRLELWELLEERGQGASTLAAACLPREEWASFIGDAALAEAISDRLVRGALTIELSGPSLRG